MDAVSGIHIGWLREIQQQDSQQNRKGPAMTYATFSLLFAVAFTCGLGIGRLLTGIARYRRGYRDGRAEERAHANARIIPAKLEACRAGRAAERANFLQN